jgi:hypothetical protein
MTPHVMHVLLDPILDNIRELLAVIVHHHHMSVADDADIPEDENPVIFSRLSILRGDYGPRGK